MMNRAMFKILVFLIAACMFLTQFGIPSRSEEPTGESIHGDLKDREILFAEETVPINAGTVFSPKVSGTITHVKVYTAKEENGEYWVQLWDYDAVEVICEYPWQIESGVEGWQYFELPEPVKVNAYDNYVVSVMNNGNSKYYARIESYFFDGEDVNSLFVTTSDSGRFSLDSSVLPNNQFNHRTYLRDIVFIPEAPSEDAPKQEIDLSDYNTVYISELKWGNSYSNAGKVTKDSATALEDLSIKGINYKKGFGMHASPREGDSFVEVNVEGLGFKTFAAYVGVADLLLYENIAQGSVVFIVSADGEELARTPVLKYGDDPFLFLVDISDAKILRFSVGPADDGIVGDVAVWCNACISKEDISKGEAIFDLAKTIETKTPEPTESTEETPMPTTSSPTDEEEDENSGIGLIIGIVAVSVLILVLGVFLIVKIKKMK
jgi:hypothetical protein